MSRKSNLVHQFLKELQKETKFSKKNLRRKQRNERKLQKNTKNMSR